MGDRAREEMVEKHKMHMEKMHKRHPKFDEEKGF